MVILGFDGALLMDLAGPVQVFGSANKALGRIAYQIETVTEDGRRFVTDTGLSMHANASFATMQAPHDYIVPGGPGVDRLLENGALQDFHKRIEPATERFISICSGSLLAASAGLLTGRQATTHWERETLAYQRFPDVHWNLDQIFTHDGKFHCSAGVTTGIDLALSLVEADHGRQIALSVAREMVVFMQRHGGQAQYSEPLKAQFSANQRHQALYNRIEANPAARWSVKEMARIAGTTERTLHRDFVRDYNQSPSRFVEGRRLAIARNYLERSSKPIKEIASLAGFGTEQNFRRCFVKSFGILPTDYRNHFGAKDKESSDT